MIQFMRGTKSQLNNNSSIIAAGQPVFESDTGQLKIGNGSSRYSALEYVGSIFENTSSGGGEVTFGGSGYNSYVDFPGGLRMSYGQRSYTAGRYDGVSVNGLYFMGSSSAGLMGVYVTSVKSTILGWTVNPHQSEPYIGSLWITHSWVEADNIMYKIAWRGTGGSNSPAFYIDFVIWSRD